MSNTDLSPAEFATAVLAGVGIEPTSANVRAFVGWEKAEGGHWNNQAKYNPLNTTQPMPGAGNTGSQGNIKVYTSWSQGIAATIATLKNGHYGGILDALKGSDASAVASAIGASPWGTNGQLVATTIGNTVGPTHVAGTTATPQASPGTTTTSPATAKVDRGPWALRQLLGFTLVAGGLGLVYFGGARVLGVSGSRPIKAGAKAAAVVPK